MASLLERRIAVGNRAGADVDGYHSAQADKGAGRFIFDDCGYRFGEFYKEMSNWVAEGRIKYHKEIVDGLEYAPRALIGLLAACRAFSQ